jgi:orotate phosphoribosyltransferase
MDPSPFEARSRRLLELLRQFSFEKKPVTLASGKKSDFYIDCRRVALTAEGHFLIGWLMGSSIRSRYPEVRGVGGMTMGADPLVSATSVLSFLGNGSPLEAFYVRKKAKEHGTAQWVESSALLEPGSQVALLEDVVTTGGSTLKAIERATAHGFEVRCVLALVDRCEGGARSISEQAEFQALFTRHDFMPERRATD